MGGRGGLLTARAGAVAVVSLVVASLAAASGPLATSAQARGHHAAAAACAAPGSKYTHVVWSPAPNGQPGQIAPFGHLQAGQSVAVTDTAVNGLKQCVPGVAVYLNLEKNAPGDSLTIPASQCGGATQLTSTVVTCITDAYGQVAMTYTAPSTIPPFANVEINDCLTLADEPSCQSGRPNYSISWRSWYQYLMTYQFTGSPIASSGSLTSSQAVQETLQASGVDGTPQMNTTIYLALQSTQASGATVTVNSTGTALTSSFAPFTTDSNGQIQMTYTAPATVPVTGIDTIVAQSDSSTAPIVYNAASYAFTPSYPTVSIGDVTTTEGDAHPNITAEFEVTLSSPQPTNVTVKYFTICGIGDKECGEDILQVKTPKTLTIPAGQTSAVIPITVYSYSSLEPYSETYLLGLSAPVGAILGRSIGTGFLLGDNETTSAELLYAGGAGVVAGAGTETAYEVVVLAKPSLTPITFQYTTNDGSAIAGTDYTAVSGTATIPAGATQVTPPISVPILPDTSPGPAKSFTITISGVTGPAAVQLATGTVTIFNIN